MSAVPGPPYALGVWFCRTILREFFSLTASGEEWVPPEGPCIIASNHASFLDPPAVASASGRDVYSFARKSLTRSKVGSWLFRSLRTVPVDRDRGNDLHSIRVVLRRLREGHAILLFPEGIRSPDGSIGTAQRGVGLLAAMAQVPLVPARIFGSFDAWGRGTGRPKFFSPLHVGFGPALAPSDYDPGPADRDRHRKIADLLMARISAISFTPEVFKRIAR
ncbi:MAG: 1-acyl-sn-glycerol-3-phosphate acyltransferase [Puniceicoccales bacterium]|nr:1-acyl-sn-glycerol-3-phosphate acyltransferase [Puniceicoccales bacterium]